jgi:16S rRNA (cytidine1402-2'-O)-methyltransferase
MLYLIATPIGNLEDISIRALNILRQVDVVASEDTRHTGRLLSHFNIDVQQMSFHEHNEHKALRRIEAFLSEGKSVALLSDAGTPGISDPGYTLVRFGIEAGLNMTMIPGPTALIMALVLSGLPTHAFTFRGYPPRKQGKRRNFIAVDVESPHTLVFYEGPHRLVAFLKDAYEVLGDRQAAVANELTKMYENVQRGRLSELIAALEVEESDIRGEYTVVIAGAG